MSAYIPKKDGTFYVNLGEDEERALLENFTRNLGKGLYDEALGSHGGMSAYLKDGVLHFSDILDYHPFESYKKLPKFIRKFEPSSIIPGAKPFKWSGDISVSNYYNPEIYDRMIQSGIGDGPLVKDVTGKVYLPHKVKEPDWDALIKQIMQNYKSPFLK